MASIKMLQTDKIAQEIFEKLAQKREKDGLRKYLGMSMIGHPCERAIWYHFREYTPKPKDGRVYAIFEFGDAVETLLISYLRLMYKVEDRDKNGNQFHFEDYNGNFAGNCDGIITLGGKRRILECKSANKNKFAAIQQKGIREAYPVYYCQAQCYMGYSGLDRALFAVMCKDNSDIYTEKMYFNADDFTALRLRAYNIINANEIPDRISDNPESYNCKYCDYRLHCWHPDMAILEQRNCKNCKHFKFSNCTGKCDIAPTCKWESIC